MIYSSDLINIQNITGDQIGAYFGYALAVLDIDGDGLDDLVIGAPMYTDFDDPAMKIETGRIYVLYQSGQVGVCLRQRYFTNICESIIHAFFWQTMRYLYIHNNICSGRFNGMK